MQWNTAIEDFRSYIILERNQSDNTVLAYHADMLKFQSLLEENKTPMNVQREDIEGIKQQQVSLMPADLHKNLTAQQLVDLVQFMKTLKKTETD